MSKSMPRLLMIVGVAVYTVLMLLQLLTQMFNVSFFSLATLGIAVQAALGLPVLGFLFLGIKLPVADYAKWFALTVAVLAISGNLGISDSVLASNDAVGLAADRQRLREDLKELDRLKLQVDLAGAESDSDRKDIEKEIKDLKDELSASEKKDIQRELAVLKAKRDVMQFKEPIQRANVAAANSRNALVILGAMLVLAGALSLKNETT